MTRVKNPRFPHSCKIVRFSNTEPMADEKFADDDPMQDETEEAVDGIDVETVEYTLDGGTVIYEGVCRSDNHYQTTAGGDVNVSYRTLSLPVKQEDWTLTSIPREGDHVELYRFGYNEYGIVIDVKPSNLGTHLHWKYVRN